MVNVATRHTADNSVKDGISRLYAGFIFSLRFHKFVIVMNRGVNLTR